MVAGLGFHFLYKVQAMSLIGNHLLTPLYIGGFGVMLSQNKLPSSLPEIIVVFVLDKDIMFCALKLLQGTVVLYIGMDEALAHYACTFENSDLNFYFQ